MAKGVCVEPSKEPYDSGVKRMRISFTKKQMEQAIVADLIALLHTVTQDGKITDEEAKELSAWLEANAKGTQTPGLMQLEAVIWTCPLA